MLVAAVGIISWVDLSSPLSGREGAAMPFGSEAGQFARDDLRLKGIAALWAVKPLSAHGGEPARSGVGAQPGQQPQQFSPRQLSGGVAG